MNTNQTIGVGLIGAGIMGQAHAAAVALDPRARFVGVASLEGADEIAAKFPGTFATRDYRDLLARKDIQVVIVATPDHAHFAICKEAIEAGKNVLVEKPLTVDLSEADRLIEIVKRSGLKLMTAFSHRWIPPYWAAHEAVEAGRLGRPVLCGPDMANFADLTEELIDTGWLLQCADLPQLWQAVAAHPAWAALPQVPPPELQGPSRLIAALIRAELKA